ncbi:metallophosphoesterase family protein [Tissierellaceae bacterium BX21]|uniref:Metallophosphoesterase family protein n=1 Tax=Paratissierella segnis TaxID=2763679 RepID=A0A926EYK2_9FIRM|nr:metallophosphoesterase [Paratissierella segnis]MBC8588769.1 metallophosphoesterase family protein [Paratissierella segnis]
MRILFFTDTHIRGNNPKNRKDDFVKTLENKLLEIVKIINDNNIDYVIHGGDLFDRPDISVSIVSRFAKILKEIKIPLYIVSGNHDIFGHNPLTVGRTMLGLLNDLDFIHIIDDKEVIILEKNNIKLQLTGQPYTYDIDNPLNKDKYIVKEIKDNVNYSIHVVHGMLLDKPFIKGIPYTLLEDIKGTKADITLSGHYHNGFKTTIIDNKYFINPGSIVRITNSLREINRIPQVVMLDLNDKINIEYVPLKCAEEGELVLDRSEIEKHIFKGERILEFKQTIDSALNFEKMDINDVLLEVSSSEGVSEEVKLEALKRIALIQMKNL